MSAAGEALRTLLATVTDVLPIVFFIFGFQVLVIGQRVPNLKRMAGGLALTVLGLAMFLVGLEQALFPLGRLMAEQLTDPAFITQADGGSSFAWVYAFAVAIGFSTTIAEPALLAVAMKASETSGGAISVWGLRAAVAVGVAFGVGLGAHRIVTGQALQNFMVAGYLVVVLQTLSAPKMMIPLAYDSGGVTTSTVTVPLITALGLGLAESVPGRSPLIDGFGLVAFASLFPIIAVLAYAQITFYWQARLARARSAATGAAPEPAKEES